MKPDDFLKEALKTIATRGTDNGYDAGEERSAAQVASVFNALTGKELTERDVWLVMVCLKLVRNQRKHRTDNVVDLIGYSALWGECEEKTTQETPTTDKRIAKPWIDPMEEAPCKPIKSREINFDMTVLFRHPDSYLWQEGLVFPQPDGTFKCAPVIRVVMGDHSYKLPQGTFIMSHDIRESRFRVKK